MGTANTAVDGEALLDFVEWLLDLTGVVLFAVLSAPPPFNDLGEGDVDSAAEEPATRRRVLVSTKPPEGGTGRR